VRARGIKSKFKTVALHLCKLSQAAVQSYASGSLPRIISSNMCVDMQAGVNY